MENTGKQDLGQRTASELAEIHRFFKTADEAYREFRKMILQEADNPQAYWPVEWIPISNH